MSPFIHDKPIPHQPILQLHPRKDNHEERLLFMIPQYVSGVKTTKELKTKYTLKIRNILMAPSRQYVNHDRGLKLPICWTATMNTIIFIT